jgi:hypothetical protein
MIVITGVRLYSVGLRAALHYCSLGLAEYPPLSQTCLKDLERGPDASLACTPRPRAAGGSRAFLVSMHGRFVARPGVGAPRLGSVSCLVIHYLLAQRVGRSHNQFWILRKIGLLVAQCLLGTFRTSASQRRPTPTNEHVGWTTAYG